MDINTKPASRVAVLAFLPPKSDTVARTTGAALGKFAQALVQCMTGTNSDAGTITISRASDAAGSGAVTIATQAYGGSSTTGDNKVFEFNVNASELTDALPFLCVTMGAAGTALTSAVILGVDGRFPPESDLNHADVTVTR